MFVTQFKCPRARADDTYRSEVIAVLRIEGCVALQPSVALRDDDFCVWVWWQRLYLVNVRRSGVRDQWVDTLSPGRATSLLTRSLPNSCGDLYSSRVP
jgi:hypothetical protein